MATQAIPAGRPRPKREAIVSARFTDEEERLLRSVSRDLGLSTSEVIHTLALNFLSAPKCTQRVPERDQRTREIIDELGFLWKT